MNEPIGQRIKLPSPKFIVGERVMTPDGLGVVMEDLAAVWVKMDHDRVMHAYRQSQCELITPRFWGLVDDPAWVPML